MPNAPADRVVAERVVPRRRWRCSRPPARRAAWRSGTARICGLAPVSRCSSRDPTPTTGTRPAPSRGCRQARAQGRPRRSRRTASPGSTRRLLCRSRAKPSRYVTLTATRPATGTAPVPSWVLSSRISSTTCGARRRTGTARRRHTATRSARTGSDRLRRCRDPVQGRRYRPQADPGRRQPTRRRHR